MQREEQRENNIQKLLIKQILGSLVMIYYKGGMLAFLV